MDSERFPPVFVAKKAGEEEWWIQSTLGDMRLPLEPRHTRWLVSEGILEKWGGNGEMESWAFGTKASLVAIRLLIPRLSLTQFIADGVAQRIAVQAAEVAPTKVFVSWPDGMPDAVLVEINVNIVKWRPSHAVQGRPPGSEN